MLDKRPAAKLNDSHDRRAFRMACFFAKQEVTSLVYSLRHFLCQMSFTSNHATRFPF